MADSAQNPPEAAAKVSQPGKKRRSRGRRFLIVLMVLVVPLVIARLALPTTLRWYVNRTLNQSPLYEGRIGRIDVYLWRGAYAISDVRILKRTGSVPVPFFAAKRIDLAMQWGALRDGKAVGKLAMEQAELNFVDSPDESDAQTGAGGPWLKMIRDLFPFRINSARIANSAIHFRVYQADVPFDVYLSNVEGSIENLTNIHDEITPLYADVKPKGTAMDQAKFEYEMKLDPFSYRPTFQIAVRLLGLDVTKINDMARHYGKFDFEKGWFDLVLEIDAKEGQVSGYVKPLFRNLQVFSLDTDLKEDNPVEFFWESLVGVATGVLRNAPRDQFGTRVPFYGDMTAPTTELLATVGNLLRNAFIRAYLPRLEGLPDSTDSLQFEPASPITDPVSSNNDGETP